MSAHNRQRRRKRATGWACQKCGQEFHPDLAAAAEQRFPGGMTFVHICASCKGLHVVAEDGRPRLMTKAEEFALRMHQGRQLEAVERTEFPLGRMVTSMFPVPDPD